MIKGGDISQNNDSSLEVRLYSNLPDSTPKQFVNPPQYLSSPHEQALKLAEKTFAKEPRSLRMIPPAVTSPDCSQRDSSLVKVNQPSSPDRHPIN